MILPIMHRISHRYLTYPAALVWGMWYRLVLGMMVCTAVAGQRAAGQTTDSASHLSQTTSALPQPLVSAGFPMPAKSIDWQQYSLPEYCQAAFQHTLEWYPDAERRKLLRGQAIDTIRDVNSWAPIPPSVIQMTRACLQRFRVEDIPPFAIPVARQLSIKIDDDSLLHAILARQLAFMPTPSVRAELLDSVVNEIMDKPWSAAHTQLARSYAAQLDALGPEAILKQLGAREQLMRPAVLANDLDTQLATWRDELRLLQQPAVAQLPEMKEKVSRNITRLESLQHFAEHNITHLNFLKTPSRDSLAKYVASQSDSGGDMYNVPAPALHCDDYYPTPQTAKPLTGPLPALPAKGQLSLLIFLGGGTESEKYYPILRRLHQEISTLQIIIEARTTAFAGRLVEDPELEAVRLHEFLANSLELPGALCVNKTQYQIMAEGHQIPNPDQDREAYHDEKYGWHMFIVDPTGKIISDDLGGSRRQDFDNLEYYMQRLQTIYDVDKSSVQSLPSR